MAKTSKDGASAIPPTSSAEQVIQPAPKSSTTAELARQYSQAQRRFDQALQEGQLIAHNILLTAFRDCSIRLQEAQRDLEGYVIEAYQDYLTSLKEVSAPSEGMERSTDAYNEFIRLGTEFWTQSGVRSSVERAYRELIATLTAAQSQPDAAARSTEALHAYVEQINEARKQAEQTQTEAEQAYSTFLAVWKDELGRRQQAHEAAYQGYVNNLKDAYTRSDIEQRASTASKDYLAAAEDSWKQSQTIHANAAAAFIDAQKNMLTSVRFEPPA